MLHGAEIDHLLTLALFKVCKLGFPIGFVLIGKAGVASKSKYLDYLVNATAPEEFF